MCLQFLDVIFYFFLRWYEERIGALKEIHSRENMKLKILEIYETDPFLPIISQMSSGLKFLQAGDSERLFEDRLQAIETASRLTGRLKDIPNNTMEVIAQRRREHNATIGTEIFEEIAKATFNE